jgi:hypothetical protein
MPESKALRLRAMRKAALVSAVLVPGISALAKAPIVLNITLPGQLPMIQVMINNKGPFQFIVDTGTGDPAVLSQSLVKTLGLSPVGETDSVDGVTKKAVKVPQYEVSLKSGDFSARHVKASALPMGREDGIVGFSLFREYLYQLDLSGGKIVLLKGSLPPANQQTIFDFTDNDGIPQIKARLGPDDIAFDIDSGQGGGILIPAVVASRITFKDKPRVIGKGASSQTEFEIKRGETTADFTLGRFIFPQPPVAFADIFDGGNLGISVLKLFVLTFDQEHKRVKFERTDAVVRLDTSR